MKSFYKSFICSLLGLCAFIIPQVSAKDVDRQSYKIYVDKHGVMRRSDTKEEVAYYGTNYTLPFAHAYRALGYVGKDRKEAIDKDVYHLKRLGFNGFRLHLWDVELADSLGNLLENEHLDLLDYLIMQLEKNGIDIVLTAQTNFGNGYPEKNIDTGAFSYDYGKCEIHSDKTAQAIQANYLEQLVSHVNPYTGKSYGDDNAIIAMEINNEPCHTDSKKEVTTYINKMVKALKKGGFNKPILYNVSHNPEVTDAYYEADIQGTTYQWYPTGLVSGHERKGNFLPYLDQYSIPWKQNMKNYDKLARVVYEFDPGDVLASYLYPAIARTFRNEGFQWITQFAYDPIDIAKYNTEYQTHFLNLAYTPSKAISMMIAGEATRNIPRDMDYGVFPNDTTFSDFLVSYERDLSVYNSGEKFYYTNSNFEKPKDLNSLKNLAGVGNSNVIEYDGTGAYFLDEVNPGIWRLEVMPDVVLVADPFEKPSLNREIAEIFYNKRDFTLKLPQLGENFYFKGINNGNESEGKAQNGRIDIYPGVYLLSADQKSLSDLISGEGFSESGLAQYVAPEGSQGNSIVVHSPKKYINKNGDLEIEADIIGDGEPDAVTIYPDYVSFWNENNTLIPMQKIGGNKYQAFIPASSLGWNDTFAYNIVVNEKGKNFTWPQNIEGSPLDWDFNNYKYYTSQKLEEGENIVLLSPDSDKSEIEVTMIPESWNFKFRELKPSQLGPNAFSINSVPEKDGKLIIRKYVAEDFEGLPYVDSRKFIGVRIWPEIASEDVTVELTAKNGATYAVPLLKKYITYLPSKLHQDIIEGVEYKIPLSAFSQSGINIVPTVYPSFLSREIEIGAMPFDFENTEFLDIVIPAKKGEEINYLIQGVWIE